MYNDHRTPTGKGYPQGGGSRQGGMDRQGYTAKEKPKLTRQNYVDEAERVIKTLERDRSEKMKLTTSKIRNLLAMAATLKTDAQHSREDKLSCDLRKCGSRMKRAGNLQCRTLKRKRICWTMFRKSGTTGKS